jgi:hypothetical protein
MAVHVSGCLVIDPGNGCGAAGDRSGAESSGSIQNVHTPAVARSTLGGCQRTGVSIVPLE